MLFIGNQLLLLFSLMAKVMYNNRKIIPKISGKIVKTQESADVSPLPIGPAWGRFI
jgi:hypothetical protein